MLLARVIRDEAEAFRKKLARRGMVRKDRRIFERNGAVLIPLHDSVDVDYVISLGGSIEEGEAMARECYKSPFEIACELISRPTINEMLPRKWEKVGDVLILRLLEDLMPYREEIARAYAQAVGARAVLRDTGHINGIHRRPVMELLYGNHTETVHFENGLYYKIDAANLMFSSGNIDEKLRIASLDCSGEIVVDMFAGIGYWTLPFAVHTNVKKIIACEINPLAFSYLKENIFLNHVEEVVQPILGDNRNLPGKEFADRIMMGYVQTTHKFLDKAFSLVRPGGIIHYQDTFPLAVCPDRAIEYLEQAAKGRRIEILFIREIKSYSPGVSHMAFDVRVLD
ncbi:MAG: class I SAM-dependent methyltransferase family protein [Euryarchaeota archaeon]|nr:class I SAM-dependent methyltransferase family protein [Euryarchaeota archaeon]